MTACGLFVRYCLGQSDWNWVVFDAVWPKFDAQLPTAHRLAFVHLSIELGFGVWDNTIHVLLPFVGRIEPYANWVPQQSMVAALKVLQQQGLECSARHSIPPVEGQQVPSRFAQTAASSPHMLIAAAAAAVVAAAGSLQVGGRLAGWDGLIELAAAGG